jgi:hypothetical protein
MVEAFHVRATQRRRAAQRMVSHGVSRATLTE